MSKQATSAVSQRRSKIVDAEEALDQVQEGMIVGRGGWLIHVLGDIAINELADRRGID
jgi:acyl CoA:acetate/3-ketoacid CoA transferase alpha subunit